MNIFEKLGIITIKRHCEELDKIMETNHHILKKYKHEYEEKYKSLQEDIQTQDKLLNFEKLKHQEEIKKLNDKIKSINGSLGGKEKYINKLKKRILELENEKQQLKNELVESMTDKYIVRKLKPDRSKGHQKQMVRSTAIESKLVKKEKESEK